MKTLPRLFVLCLFVNVSLCMQAQVVKSSRPELFSSFSTNIPASISELDKAFAAAPGSLIQFNFTDKFSFSGTVLSSVQKYNNLSSVIIKSSLLKNSLLSISRRINDDNTITYVGRIINEKYADGYELKKDNTGNYSFNKIKTEDLIQDF
ncbi:MAG: hypothetical protein ACRDE8_02075 [Ginsengibacter sp.]